MLKHTLSFALSAILTSSVIAASGSFALPKGPEKSPLPQASPSSSPLASPSPLDRFRLLALPDQPKLPLLSWKGQEIEIYKFGQGKEEYVFLFGNFHGDEPQGEYLLRQFMQELLNKPGEFANKTIFCMPLLNPDGTRQKTRVNAKGVDLNRNFPTKNFVQGLHKGTRYYAGPHALSEPESKIVSALLKPYLNPGEKEKVKILSIHSPLAVNNYDGPALHLAQAMKMENRLKATANIGYPTPGSFGTYYGTEWGIPVITLETSRQSGPEAWKTHRKALWAFLNTPVHPPPQGQTTHGCPPTPPGHTLSTSGHTLSPTKQYQPVGSRAAAYPPAAPPPGQTHRFWPAHLFSPVPL